MDQDLQVFMDIKAPISVTWSPTPEQVVLGTVQADK